MLFQCIIKPVQTGTRGIAADTGIDDLVAVFLFLQALLQKSDPALFGIESPGSADTITKHQDYRFICTGMAVAHQ